MPIGRARVAPGTAPLCLMEVPMGSVTYFVALPFAPGDDGEIQAGEPVEAQSPSGARDRARAMASQGAGHGGVAFSRTGDPNIGEFADAVILGRYGATPDDLAAYVAG